MIAVLLIEPNSDHDSVLPRERRDPVAIATWNRRRHLVRVRILPPKNRRLREHRDLRVLRGRRFKRVFNTTEVSLSVAVDHENLTDCEADVPLRTSLRPH